MSTRKTTKAPLRTQNSYAVIEGNDPDFEGKQKAFVIHLLVSSLMGNDSAPLPYSKTELFLDLCRQSVDALDRQPESMHLSPAAPALLRYLREAMARYVEAATTAELDSPKAWSTTLRNTSLAKALYVGDEKKQEVDPSAKVMTILQSRSYTPKCFLRCLTGTSRSQQPSK